MEGVELERCMNCSFAMKAKRKLKCSLENSYTQEHYICDKFISKVKFVNDISKGNI